MRYRGEYPGGTDLASGFPVPYERSSRLHDVDRHRQANKSLRHMTDEQLAAEIELLAQALGALTAADVTVRLHVSEPQAKRALNMTTLVYHGRLWRLP